AAIVPDIDEPGFLGIRALDHGCAKQPQRVHGWFDEKARERREKASRGWGAFESPPGSPAGTPSVAHSPTGPGGRAHAWQGGGHLRIHVHAILGGADEPE